MFLIFWKRVCLGMWKLAHWRKNCVIDSKSLPQVQKGLNSSWKQCLNICSWRRLRPRRNPHPIQDGLFRGCSQMRGVGGGAAKGPLPKICHTYRTMMKLGSYTLPKEDPKNIWITWHTPWVLLTSAFFHRKSANFAISRNTDIDCILVHNF